MVPARLQQRGSLGEQTGPGGMSMDSDSEEPGLPFLAKERQIPSSSPARKGS